jgi:hypothetical protein
MIWMMLPWALLVFATVYFCRELWLMCEQRDKWRDCGLDWKCKYYASEENLYHKKNQLLREMQRYEGDLREASREVQRLRGILEDVQAIVADVESDDNETGKDGEA